MKLVTDGLKNFDPMHDYTQDLEEGDIKVEGNREFVFLKGLERLAKERGIKSSRCIRLEPIMYKNDAQEYLGAVVSTYEYEFLDGCIYQGTADATVKNCDGNFKLYLSAMSESRSKARALRSAFGISLCSVEEKSDMSYLKDEEVGPIQPAQEVGIKTLAERNGYSREEVIGMLEVTREISSLKELTSSEAKELLVKLNKRNRKKKK